MTEMTQHALRARGLWLGYGEREVIKGLDLDIAQGRFTAILGPNGCGKSTVLKALSGLQPCRKGAVDLDGQPIARLGGKPLARRVSILSQGGVPPDGLTVIDLVRQGRYPHRALFSNWGRTDTRAVDAALAQTGITHLANRPLQELSGGQRQRAWIAMTLAQEARILLLDEPTTFLDPAHQLEVLALLRDLVETRGATVVAVLHDRNQAAHHADWIVMMKDGTKMAQGPPKTVMTKENLAQVFGIDVTIMRDPETDAPVCLPRPAKRAN